MPLSIAKTAPHARANRITLRLWRYVASGSPDEIDPSEVMCELAGE